MDCSTGTCGVKIAPKTKGFDQGHDGVNWDTIVKKCVVCGRNLVYSDKEGWNCKRCGGKRNEKSQQKGMG